MKPLLYITAALILIAAVVPVHAAYDTSLVPVRYTDSTTQAVPKLFADASAYSAYCTGLGYTTSSNYNSQYLAYKDGDVYSGSNIQTPAYGGTLNVDTNWRYVQINSVCKNATSGSDVYTLYAYDYRAGYDYVDAINANFTATPTQGSGPLPVVLTDTSTGGGIVSYNWSISPATGWYVTAGTINEENVEINFVTNGNYSVSHGIANNTASDVETKTDYIWVYNSTNLITTQIWAIDGTSEGYPIQGAQIDIQDIENSSWTNTTTGANGKAEIVTLGGHTFNAYGSATGFSDADLLAQPVGGGYQLVMFRQGATNVTAGNVTLYVTVVDDDTTFRIASADVTAAWGTLYTATKTDSAGIAQMTVPNNTAIHVSAFKAGYAGASKTISSGTGSGGDAQVSVEIKLARSVVTTVPTTTGNGTAVTTADPYPCIGDGSAEDNANCQRKQGGMAADLITMGPTLVQFFIMLTFLGGIMLITKRR